jgi:hypothetical protein
VPRELRHACLLMVHVTDCHPDCNFSPRRCASPAASGRRSIWSQGDSVNKTPGEAYVLYDDQTKKGYVNQLPELVDADAYVAAVCMYGFVRLCTRQAGRNSLP